MAKKIQIFIDATGSWLDLPKCYYTVEAKDESILTTMHSGRMVEDTLGQRIYINGTFSYIPPEDLSKLVLQARKGGFTQVKYDDNDGTLKTAYFKIEPIKATVFKYVNNNPVWCDIPLSLTAREVTLNV